MAHGSSFLLCLFAAAWVGELAGEAVPGHELRGHSQAGIAACSCVNLECQCELGGSTSVEAGASEKQKSVEQVQELAKWWGQNMKEAEGTGCSCTGSACYCSHASKSEQAHVGHVGCMCTGSNGETCHCGQAELAGADNGPEVAAEQDEHEVEERLLGQTQQMSKFWGHYHHPWGPHYPPHVCHCYHGFWHGHVCHCFHPWR